ncbi:MAG TPA: PfkB family carbohydrate kinase, partial [Gemmatimonadaceae bacterium]|nr:PfkB family carbohydrate kinase [Gemmatimonadaceae bacterium]
MAPPSSLAARLPRSRLLDLLDAASRTRIAVIGDAMVDVYVRGDVDRISPEAPVPVLRVRGRRHALGGAGNVAQNIRALGSGCDLVAAVGSDPGGTHLRGMLDAIGAGHTSLVEVARPTTTKTRIVAGSQQVVRVDDEDDTDLDGPDVARLLDAVTAAIDAADALVLEDYNKGVLVPDVIASAIARARARRIPIVVDPKFRNFFSYRGATIFKPNRREFESALGAALNLDHPETLPSTFDRLGVEHLLLTLGERGMMLISANGAVESVPAFAREVFDVVGAGDTVTAYLAAILAAGGSAAEAAIAANFAAGVEVGKAGA